MARPSVLTPMPDGQPRPKGGLALGLAQPVRVEIPASLLAPPVRITAVVPCYNRPEDARKLLGDLAGLLLPRIDLRVLLVDNASDAPLSAQPTPAGLNLEHLRLETNTGGSGGFNAGIARALQASDAPDFVWLLDSDARVEPETLEALVNAMTAHPGLVVAGSALADPATGEVFELGGHVDRRSGLLVQPPATLDQLGRDVVPVEYVAACSMLVRAGAIPAAGLMPDVFVNGDDVGWCLRLGRIPRRSAAGFSEQDEPAIAVVPRSRARHPHHDKMHTWGRYYIARNAFGPMDALHLGGLARFRRAMREAIRAAFQQFMNRPDLARLHIAGLRDARGSHTSGPAPAGTVRFDPFEPLSRLGERVRAIGGARVTVEPGLELSSVVSGALTQQLGAAGLSFAGAPSARASLLGEGLGALGRLVASPFWARNRLAIVSARGRPGSWFRGTIQLQIINENTGSFILRPTAPFRCSARAITTLVHGTFLSLRLAASPVAPPIIPAAPVRTNSALGAGHSALSSPATGTAPRTPSTLSILILSHNRFPALERTLGRLLSFSSLRNADMVVVDNASTDGTQEKLAAKFPQVRCIPLKKNIGVAAFNRAAALSSADHLLILDDDAVPEEAALVAAIGLLERRPDVGAVTLHPRHPATNQSEWRFASRADPVKGHDAWPVMGCGNLVRREAWIRAVGYEESFFLYRNDTDLALKLLALGGGKGVHFNPGWVVWHDSLATARKSPRWHHLATRNWVWLARRHCGTGLAALAWGALGVVLGTLWAHRLAGLNAKRHLATIKGLFEGLGRRPAPAPPSTGQPWRALLRFHLAKPEK